MSERILILLLFALITLSGCDIFDTRQAELPSTPRVNLEPATTPEIAVNNLSAAFREKNIQAYISVFSDSSNTGKNFSFTASSGSELKYGGIFNEWGIQSEERYYTNLSAANGESGFLQMTATDLQTISFGDSSYINMNYEISVQNTGQSNISGFSGGLQLKMIKDKNSLWRIFSVTDIKSSESLTWSDLKGINY